MFDQTRPDQTSYDSSFFHTSYQGKKVLVLVPHQDDELNVAANSIYNFVHSGAEVFVAYATNGDYEYKVKDDTRLHEAINALSVLGVDKAHIFCLGYGDTINNSLEGHIFYSDDVPVKSPHGVIETYGYPELDDFAYFLRKQHSPYTKNNYLRDLQDLVLYVHADIILAVDFDQHADHRMLSLSFETVMGRILSRPDNDYRPEVFKGFAYAVGGWSSVKDFFADNLLESQKPEHSPHDKDIIDTSCYDWAKRVRIPIPEGARKPVLAGNILAEALSKHDSQKAISRADAIINSDEVFFSRRTDSLTFSAHVSAASGNPDYAHDFKLVNVKDVDSFVTDWADYLWQPDNDDTEKQLVFTWKNEQKISRVVLWGNIDGTPIQRVRITMDNGYAQEFGPLPEGGLPLVIDVPAQSQEGIRELNVKILDAGGADGGLAEVEAFSELEQQGVIKPFIQVTCRENFAYCYLRKPEESRLPVNCYCYRTTEPVKYEVSGPAHLEGKNLVFDGNDDVILRAESGELYCQSVFHTATTQELDALHAVQKKEDKKIQSIYYWFMQKNRVISYMRRFRERGFVFTLKYGIGKLAAKLRRKITGDDSI